MNINIPEGKFFGNEIEPGTFHAGISFLSTDKVKNNKVDSDKDDTNSSENESSEPDESQKEAA